MNYGYGYNYPSLQTPAVSAATGSAVWTIVSIILAIIGGVIAYYLFVKPETKQTNKFLAWLKEFCQFKKLLIESILKVTYLILAIFITLYSFNLISTSFFAFLLMLVLGNVILRIIYEYSIMLIMICKNTTDINAKIKKAKETKE